MTTTHETVTEATARRVREAIQLEERAVSWVGDKAGFAEPTFRRKVRGHSGFTLGELARVAEVLNIPAARLLPDAFLSAEDAA